MSEWRIQLEWAEYHHGRRHAFGTNLYRPTRAEADAFARAIRVGEWVPGPAAVDVELVAVEEILTPAERVEGRHPVDRIPWGDHHAARDRPGPPPRAP